MGLSDFFQAKRDLLAGLLRGTGFEPVPAAGTYFQLVDYSALSESGDTEFADRLIREAKVATIPLSPFYAAAPPMTLLRLCIAKRDETLEAAAERLRRFAARVYGAYLACAGSGSIAHLDRRQTLALPDSGR